MSAVEICLYLVSLCISLLTIFTYSFAAFRLRGLGLVAFTLLVSLSAICCVGMLCSGTEPFDRSLIEMLIEAKPRILVLTSAGLLVGIGSGVVAVSAMRVSRSLWLKSTFSATILTLVSAGLLLAWDDEFDIERFKATAVDPGWVVEEIASTEQTPIRLALDQERNTLYFCTYSTGINGVFGGSLYSISVPHRGGRSEPVLAVSSPLLYRPFGLAVRNGEVLISRAGHAAHARDGQVEYCNLGAVTRVRDLDGDGQFEYFDDVIRSIPAARAPDTMHQNNGLCIDDLGNLYVAVGSADDRSVDAHKWSGTILQLAPGDNEPLVFARGLRNPFGICSGPEQSLFVTDNDCAEDPGDELNCVFAGHHCGHPFAIPGSKRSEGFNEAILVGTESNFCGVGWLPASDTTEVSGHVFVCDRLKNVVLSLRVSVSNGQCTVLDNRVLARIPAPIDLVVARTGELFVASLTKQRIYRISQL